MESVSLIPRPGRRARDGQGQLGAAQHHGIGAARFQAGDAFGGRLVGEVQAVSLDGADRT